MLEHRMARERDLAVDAHAGRPRRGSHEADGEVGMVLGDAVETPEKIEVPPRAAQLPIRDATKAQFFLGYLERGAPLFASQDDADVHPCERCDQPTTGRFCAFCRARAQILGERLGAPAGGGAGGDEGERPGDPVSDRDVADGVSDEVMPVEVYGSR